MERRYHNPYRHLMGGLGTEIAVFAAVIALLVVVTLLAGLWVR